MRYFVVNEQSKMDTLFVADKEINYEFTVKLTSAHRGYKRQIKPIK